MYCIYFYFLCLPNVVPEGGDAGGGDAVAQGVQFRDAEHALLLVEDQTVGGKDG